jgi:hypothetical protein
MAETSQTSDEDGAGASSLIRTAVVFIHGQGEQQPMESILELARALWATNPDAAFGLDRRYRRSARYEARQWSAPDNASGLYDLWRVSTEPMDKHRVDFYEFYWAHLMEGTRVEHVWAWFVGLLQRDGAEIPAPLRPVRSAAAALGWATIWLTVAHILLTALIWAQRLEAQWAGYSVLALAWILITTILVMRQGLRARATAFLLSVGALGASAALSLALIEFKPWAALSLLQQTHVVFSLAAGILIASGAAAFWWFNRTFLSPVMGDSARFLSPRPENLAARQEIRTRGVDLIRALHESDRYDRIVIVAHSLGSIIGYAILSHYWGIVSPFLARPGEPEERLQALEHAARAVRAHDDDHKALRAFRAAQRDYARTLSAMTAPERKDYDADGAPNPGHSLWLITDFITLGSPLTYAPLLLAANDAEFHERMRIYRTFAACPPVLADYDPVSSEAHDQKSFSFRPSVLYGDPRESDTLRPDHSAVFAPTRWTNLFFRADGLVAGDAIGGALRKETAVEHERYFAGVLDIPLNHQETGVAFAHNHYWRFPKEATAKRSKTWKARSALKEEFGAASRYPTAFDDPAPEHIEALRDAVNIFEQEPAEHRSLGRAEPRKPARVAAGRPSGRKSRSKSARAQRTRPT